MSDAVTGAAGAASLCVCEEPPPNNELIRSPNGTDPEADEVVPEAFGDDEPSDEQPAAANATASNAAAGREAVRRKPSNFRRL